MQLEWNGSWVTDILTKFSVLEIYLHLDSEIIPLVDTNIHTLKTAVSKFTWHNESYKFHVLKAYIGTSAT